jgi:hypothetical protein
MIREIINRKRENFAGRYLGNVDLKSQEGGGKKKLRRIFQKWREEIRSGLNCFRSRPITCFAVSGVEENMVRFSHTKRKDNILN